MEAATVVTLVDVFVMVAALATYLVVIALTLRDVSFTLGTILIGVRAISARPIPSRPTPARSSAASSHRSGRTQLLSWGRPAFESGAERPMLTR